MIYQMRDISRRIAGYPLASMMRTGHDLVNHQANPLRNTVVGRFQSAALESGYRLLKHYPKPRYELKTVEVDGQTLPITKEIVVEAPFGDLIRFRHARSDQLPKVLFVAALSGHYATLSQNTYREFLAEYDVYVTDWKSARDVPLSEGRFGFEEYVGYLIDFLRKMGPGAHLVGICQAAVPALVAAAVMADEEDDCRPRTMTLMAGPIDTRVNPNKALDAMSKVVSKEAFKYALRTVPEGYVGRGRKVYPGWAQLGMFVSMHFLDHVTKHVQFFGDVFTGNKEAAQKHRDFYDDYFATLDGAGEFYLETLERVFFEFHLPQGKMQHRGKTVNCSAIKDIALLTVEGEEDDMCLVGTTQVAHELCDQIPEGMRDHHLQPGVGHYGVFNGSRYQAEIAPRIKTFMQTHEVTQAPALNDDP